MTGGSRTLRRARTYDGRKNLGILFWRLRFQAGNGGKWAEGLPTDVGVRAVPLHNPRNQVGKLSRSGEQLERKRATACSYRPRHGDPMSGGCEERDRARCCHRHRRRGRTLTTAAMKWRSGERFLKGVHPSEFPALPPPDRLAYRAHFFRRLLGRRGWGLSGRADFGRIIFRQSWPSPWMCRRVRRLWGVCGPVNSADFLAFSARHARIDGWTGPDPRDIVGGP